MQNYWFFRTKENMLTSYYRPEQNELKCSGITCLRTIWFVALLELKTKFC